MPTTILPILALDIGEIISILIAIGVILSGIFGQANEAKKAKEKRQAKQRGEGGSVTQLDEIAQRRRQQLEALAKQRRGGGAQPDNLTVAQASERETARAAYDERAAALRAQETSDATRWSDDGLRSGQTALDARMSSRQAQREQRQAQREAQLEAQRRRQQEKAERKLQQQRQRQAQQQQRQRQTQQTRRSAPPPPLAMSGEDPVHRRIQLSDEERRQETAEQASLDQVYAVAEAEAAPVAEAKRGRPRLEALLGGRSLREALILKEVLDPPRSLRGDL